MTEPTSISEALASRGARTLDMGALTGLATEAGIIVTLPESEANMADLGAGSQLWVRMEGDEAKVDWRPSPSSSWGLGQFHGLTAVVAP